MKSLALILRDHREELRQHWIDELEGRVDPDYRELLASPLDDEILPIEYDDNYVTVFPGETVQIQGRVPPGGPAANWVRVTGYNSAPTVVQVR